MDLNELNQKLKVYYPDGKTLELPAQNNLESASISDLIQTYFPSDPPKYAQPTLKIEISAIPPSDKAIIFVGTAQLFKDQPAYAIQANFVIVNNQAELAVYTTGLTQSWNFGATFPDLKSTILAQFAFSAPTLAFSSVDGSALDPVQPYKVGLNFKGIPEDSGPLKSVAWLIPDREHMELAGQIHLTAHAPEMYLTVAGQSGVELSPSITLVVGLELISEYLPKGSTDFLSAEAKLTANLTIGGGERQISIPLALDLWTGNQPVTALQLGGGDYPIPSFSQLNALASGLDFSQHVPSQLPSSNIFSISSLTLFIAPKLKRLSGIQVSVKIAPDKPWVIIPPDILAVTSLGVSFNVLSPLHNPSITATVFGQFAIGDAFKYDVSVTVPDLILSGSLAPNSEIQVGKLLDHFLGSITGPTTGLPSSPLTVYQLDLLAAPLEKTYSLQAAVKDVWTIPLPIIPIQIEAIKAVVNYTNNSVSGIFVAELNIDDILLEVVAEKIPGDNGWNFSIGTAPGSVIDLISILKKFLNPGTTLPSFIPTSIQITNALFAINSKTLDYSIQATTAIKWELSFGGGIDFSITAAISIQSTTSPAPPHPLFLLPTPYDREPYALLPLPQRSMVGVRRELAGDSTRTYSGTISGEIAINNLKIFVTYSFDNTNSTLVFGITFKGLSLTATLTKIDKDGQQQTILTVGLGGISFGGIIEFLVNLAAPYADFKLDSPWDILNDIKLDNLSLVINLTTKSVGIAYKFNGLNLGLISLDEIGLIYQKRAGRSTVDIKIGGRFLDQTYDFNNNPLTWDLLNDPPPQPPGKGSKLLDLKYFGLGQHVTLANLDKLNTITAVIDQLKQFAKPADDPAKGLPPGVIFDAGSGWLIGAQFVLIDTVALSAIFNDPVLYGLLVSLSGEKAEKFAGFSFEILYKKVTDDIGVYHIELKVPDALRQLDFGEVSITLPIIDLDIYTNGNFRIDAGFPVGLDFSRSFSIQALPFVGYGGFYFALLNGSTSKRVPKISNGNFSPVIEFGLALSLGLGKTIDKGVLKAGLSVTAIGIVEGVIAWFNPNSSAVKSDRYYWLQGTFAIVGKLYGEVDFGIISAGVTATAYVSATVVIEAYQPILLELEVGVEVEVSVKILFFRIHFGFKITLHESFTIGSASNPPWQTIGDGASSARPELVDHPRLLRMQRSFYRPRRFAPGARWAGMQNLAAAPTFNWTPPQLPGGPQPLDLTLTPAFTLAAPQYLLNPPDPKGPPQVQAVMQLSLENSIDPAARRNAHLRTLALDHETASSRAFNLLVDGVLRWMIYAATGRLAGEVTYQNLSDLLDALKDQATLQAVFLYPQLQDFISKNYQLIIHAPPSNAAALAEADEQSHTIFPMPPPLAYTQPDGTKVDFSALNVPADYKAKVAAYFAQLQADPTRDVAACAPGATGPGGAVAQRAARIFAKLEDDEMSLATLIFQDYFAMLAKSALENAENLLSAYPFSVPAGASGPTGPAGLTLGQIASQFGVDPEAILSANQASPTVLQPGLALDLSGILYQVQSGDTISAIAGRFPTMGLTGPTGAVMSFGMTGPTGAIQALVYANSDAPVLQPQAALELDQIAYTAQSGDTIEFVAAFLQARNQEDIQAPDYGWMRQTIADYNPGKLPVDPGQPIAPSTLLAIPILPSPTGPTGPLLLRTAYAEPAPGFAGPLGIAGLALAATGPTGPIGPTGPHVNYTTRAGDTLDLVAGYFALLGDNQIDPAFLAALKALNPTIHAGQPLSIPPLEHTVRPADTLDAIAESLNNPLGALALTNATTENLLAPLSVLQIPAVRHIIRPNETLADIANAYNLTLGELAQATSGQPLFAPTVAGATGPGSQPLTIPQVQQIDIDKLSSAMIAGGWYNNVSATVARFLVHGLRLPNPGDPAFEALSVQDLLAGDQIFDLFSAYDMDGQQFAVTGDQIDVTFEKPAGVPWIEFAHQGPTGPTGPLVPLGSTAGADSLQIRLTDIAGEFPSTTFTPHPSPSPLPLVYDVPARYGLQSVIHWQSADPPSFAQAGLHAFAPAAQGPLGYLEMRSIQQFLALPASGPTGSNIPLAGEPTLWPFPDTFLQRLQSSAAPSGPTGAAYAVFTRSQTPGAGPATGTYGGAPTPVSRFQWATQIEIKIRRVAADPASAAWMPNTYLMLGADQDGRQTLLQIWDYLSRTGAGAEIYLLYPPNPTAINRDGLASDKIDRQQTFLLQTNLSTLTHSGPQLAAAWLTPPSQGAYFATLEPTASTSFIRLLWECSVVGSGGFYLNYVNAVGGAGLPSTLFSNSDEGSIWLVVAQTAQSRSVYSFNNCAIIGDNIDISKVSVFAQWAGTPGATGPSADASLVPTMPPGNIGFQVMRPNPDPFGPTGPAIGPTARTQNLFNVLSYQIYGSTGPSGATGPLSRQSVPLGPVEHDEAATGGLPLPAFLKTPPATWNFHHVAPAYKVIPDQNIPVCPALPAAAESPYGGISDSREVELQFDFHEIYGNRTIPSLAPGESLALPVKLGYYDELIPLAKWPGIGVSYLFEPGDPQPTLSAALSLQLDQSLPGPNRTVQQAACGASAHQLKYGQIYYQVQQPDLSFSMSTSVDQHSAQRPYPIADKTLLTNFVSSAYVFLGALTHLQPTLYTIGSQPQKLLDVAAAVSAPAGALLAANAGATPADLFDSSLLIPEYWTAKYGDSLASISQSTASYQITAQTLSRLDVAGVPTQVVNLLKTLETTVYAGEIAFLDAVRNAIGAGATSEYQALILTNAIDQDIPVLTLATNNQAAPLNPGVVIQTAPRTFTVTNKDIDSLAALAVAQQCSVQGLGAANADNAGPSNNPGIFTPQTTLTVQDAIVVTAAADTFNSLRQQFNAQLKPSGAVVTVDDIAVANQTVQGIFAYDKDPAVALAIADYVVQKGDTLASLAAKGVYGTFDELVSRNQNTANLFATGAALLLRATTDSSVDGESLEKIVFDRQITYAQLASANGSTPFKPGVELEIPALATVARPGLYAPYIAAQGAGGVSSDTLAAIADKFSVDAGSLAQIDQYLPALFAAGQAITLGQEPNQRSHTILAADTFQSLFAIFKGLPGISTLADFAGAIQDMSILRAGALVISELPQLASAQTLAQTAESLGVTADSLALVNCATYGFLAAGSKISLERTATSAEGQKTPVTFPVTTGTYDTFNSLVFLFQQAFAAYEQQNPGSTLSSPTTSVSEIATAGATVPGLVAAGRPFLAPPVAPVITAAVTPSYPKSIFAVTVAIEISRNPQLIAPDAQNAPNIGHVSSSLVPQTSATSQDPHSLKAFALDFEAAFPGLKAATGKQTIATGGEAETRQIWAVDFGAQGISVSIPPYPQQFYALKPLSNQLLSRENVTIYPYVSGEGLIT